MKFYDINSELNTEPEKKLPKKLSLLDQIRDIEEDSTYADYTNPPSLSGSIFSSRGNSYGKIVEDDTEDVIGGDNDEWLQSIEVLMTKPSKKARRKIESDLFESAGIKKKKKKKKKQGDMVDYKKEFEPEMALYKNLLIAQNRFTDTLQRNYDQITGTKSSNRGMTKQMTDLVENITQARALSMQLVEKNVNAKKLIAELNFKQKKEFGGGLDGDNMNDFASTYLKQVMDARGEIMKNREGIPEVSEMTDEEILNQLNSSLASSEEGMRSDEVDNFLKYTNVNATTYVFIPKDENGVDDVEAYEFITKDEDGNELPDYPAPLHTRISVNRSTNTATDSYGEKYPIIWDYV